jgi:hypothetical protein
VSNNNYGSQSGDGSINVGGGDFRGANLNINNAPKDTFSIDELAVQRHPSIFNGRVVKNETLGTFGIITGLASIVGLYFTLFQGFPHTKYASWSSVFLFSFVIAWTAFILHIFLKRRRFESFPSRRTYLELGNRGGVYMNRITATCPWCGSGMNLRNVGPTNGPRSDEFVCERNSVHHRIRLDHTCLPEIEESDE